MLPPCPYLQVLAGVLVALMSALTQWNELNLMMEELENIIVGILENRMTLSPSCSSFSHVSAWMASSPVMIETKKSEWATHLDTTVNIAGTDWLKHVKRKIKFH